MRNSNINAEKKYSRHNFSAYTVCLFEANGQRVVTYRIEKYEGPPPVRNIIFPFGWWAGVLNEAGFPLPYYYTSSSSSKCIMA